LFAGLIDRAKEAASHLVLKYVARATVTIPFIIALGFAVAAVALMLVERFGHVVAYWIMAVGFAAIGAVAAIAVYAGEHEEEMAEQKAAETDTQEVVSDAVAQAMLQTPLALLGAIFTTPSGSTTALKVARILGRNFPLVLLLVMIGALCWSASDADNLSAGEAEGRPNGMRSVDTYR
jgi:hypothetical protein